MDENKLRKNDLILVLLLLLVGFLLWGGVKLYGLLTTKNAKVIVTVDGTIYKTYDLCKDVKEQIEFEEGGYNSFEIKEGVVTMTEADCRDLICVHHKGISKNGESIVCLPHKLVISIESDEESDLDSLAQ